MKFSLNWIKEYTKIVMTPDELKDRLSVSLTEVESMENFGERFKDIVVGEVEEVEAHPTVGNLLVLKLDIGTRHVQVVVQRCPMQKGDKVPYLPPGVVVPGEIGSTSGGDRVKRVDVKGVSSDGMVPSGRELGLNYDHTTVYSLDAEAKPGSPFNQELDITDQIFEIKNKALTHRSDLFSIEGIAREIAAIQKTKYRPLAWLEDWKSMIPANIEDRLPIRIENDSEALCKRYTAVVLDSVEVGPSPRWMQIRLAKLGIRPVNNVVDISNYLMLEVGQPNHAFDYDKVVSKDPQFDGTAIIHVRMARGGETITTIEGALKELHDNTVVISDSTNPIGIAGVMGGKDTEISNDTKRVIFQVENLDQYNIRRTSMKLGIFTDAVSRFSRGLDPNRCEPVLYQGMHLLQEIAGARIASKVQDVYKDKRKERSITFSSDGCRARIGEDITDDTMVRILERLGMSSVIDGKHKTITARIPTWRRDISIPEDVDEEVVRLFGYDHIRPTLPVRSISPVPENESRSYRVRVKEILCEGSGNEFYTYSFVGRKLYEHVGLDISAAHAIMNPVSPDLGYMRPLILPSLVDKVPQNLKYRREFAAFEVDMVNPLKTDGSMQKSLPVEPWHVALLHTVSFYHSRKYLDLLMSSLHVRSWDIERAGKIEPGRIPAWVRYAQDMFHPSRFGYILAGAEIIGVIGRFADEACDLAGLPSGASGFEISLSDLESLISLVPDYKDPSKFPAVSHDLCFVTKASVPYNELLKAVWAAEGAKDLLRSVECLDIFTEEQRVEEKKTTLRVCIQSYDRTLEKGEIDTLRSSIEKSVARVVGGHLAMKAGE